MASQQPLPFAQAIDCRIGRRTTRPEIVAQAARVLASAGVPKVWDWRTHCAQINATIPALQTEAE